MKKSTVELIWYLLYFNTKKPDFLTKPRIKEKPILIKRCSSLTQPSTGSSIKGYILDEVRHTGEINYDTK